MSSILDRDDFEWLGCCVADLCWAVVVSQNAMAPALRRKEARRVWMESAGIGDWRLRLKKLGGVKRIIQPIEDGSDSQELPCGAQNY
jgi:hypothetical protein